MKKLIFGALALLCLASCSYRVYPVGTLMDNYNLVMQSPEERAAKENVAIYLSENEVPGPYKLIAFVENRPVLPIFIASQQLKNFYKQAVMKADALGGNAIIVNSIRSFKVIEVSGRAVRPVAPREMPHAPGYRSAPRPRFIPVRGDKPEEKAERPARPARPARNEAVAGEESAKPAAKPAKEKTEPKPAKEKSEPAAKPAREEPATQPVTETPAPKTVAKAPVQPVIDEDSPVFDESTVQWFTSGYVYRAKEQEQTEIIDAMNSEIRDNLKICKTPAEAECIAKKIDLLEHYNQALPMPSGTQANRIKGYRNTLKRIQAGFESAKQQGGVVDDAVQSVKGLFDKVKGGRKK